MHLSAFNIVMIGLIILSILASIGSLIALWWALHSK